MMPGQSNRFIDWADEAPNVLTVGDAGRQSLDAFRVQQLGHVGGYDIWLVDGTLIRDELDVDYVGGGNPERYQYIPAGEVWLESTLDPRDYLPFIIHEVYEAHLMASFDMEYEDAHGRANEFEKALRWSRATWENEDPIQAAQELIESKLPNAGFEHEQQPDQTADEMLNAPGSYVVE